MNNLFMLFIVVPILSLILLTLNVLLSSHKPDEFKLSSYECGFTPIQGQTRSRFNIHFYIVAMLFLIFDLEILLLFPISVTLYEVNFFGFTIISIFVLILIIGFIIEIGSGVISILPKSNIKYDDNQIINNNTPNVNLKKYLLNKSKIKFKSSIFEGYYYMNLNNNKFCLYENIINYYIYYVYNLISQILKKILISFYRAILLPTNYISHNKYFIFIIILIAFLSFIFTSNIIYIFEEFINKDNFDYLLKFVIILSVINLCYLKFNFIIRLFNIFFKSFPFFYSEFKNYNKYKHHSSFLSSNLKNRIIKINNNNFNSINLNSLIFLTKSEKIRSSIKKNNNILSLFNLNYKENNNNIINNNIFFNSNFNYNSNLNNNNFNLNNNNNNNNIYDLILTMILFYIINIFYLFISSIIIIKISTSLYIYNVFLFEIINLYSNIIILIISIIYIKYISTKPEGKFKFNNKKLNLLLLILIFSLWIFPIIIIIIFNNFNLIEILKKYNMLEKYIDNNVIVKNEVGYNQNQISLKNYSSQLSSISEEDEDIYNKQLLLSNNNSNKSRSITMTSFWSKISLSTDFLGDYSNDIINHRKSHSFWDHYNYLKEFLENNKIDLAKYNIFVIQLVNEAKFQDYHNEQLFRKFNTLILDYNSIPTSDKYKYLEMIYYDEVIYFNGKFSVCMKIDKDISLLNSDNNNNFNVNNESEFVTLNFRSKDWDEVEKYLKLERKKFKNLGYNKEAKVLKNIILSFISPENYPGVLVLNKKNEYVPLIRKQKFLELAEKDIETQNILDNLLNNRLVFIKKVNAFAFKFKDYIYYIPSDNKLTLGHYINNEMESLIIDVINFNKEFHLDFNINNLNKENVLTQIEFYASNKDKFDSSYSKKVDRLLFKYNKLISLRRAVKLDIPYLNEDLIRNKNYVNYNKPQIKFPIDPIIDYNQFKYRTLYFKKWFVKELIENKGLKSNEPLIDYFVNSALINTDGTTNEVNKFLDKELSMLVKATREAQLNTHAFIRITPAIRGNYSSMVNSSNNSYFPRVIPYKKNVYLED